MVKWMIYTEHQGSPSFHPLHEPGCLQRALVWICRTDQAVLPVGSVRSSVPRVLLQGGGRFAAPGSAAVSVEMCAACLPI